MDSEMQQSLFLVVWDFPQQNRACQNVEEFQEASLFLQTRIDDKLPAGTLGHKHVRQVINSARRRVDRAKICRA